MTTTYEIFEDSQHNCWTLYANGQWVEHFASLEAAQRARGKLAALLHEQLEPTTQTERQKNMDDPIILELGILVGCVLFYFWISLLHSVIQWLKWDARLKRYQLGDYHPKIELRTNHQNS